MTFIKYTNDGKAVIQPAALTLSGLEQEETLEMHTLENAMVLLKQEMEPVEKAAAMMALMRLAHSLWEDMLAGWEDQKDDADPCDGCSGCGEDMPERPRRQRDGVQPGHHGDASGPGTRASALGLREPRH